MAYGQDITTVNTTWSSLKTFNINTGESVDETTTVTSYKKDHIVWKGSDNVVRYDFTVKETDGTWMNIGQPGSFTYEVDCNGKSGNITFEKTANDIRVRALLLTDSDPVVFELSISGIAVN